MVTSTHEALIRGIQEEPAVIARLFQALGMQIPETKSIAMVSVDVTEVLPLERRIDLAARFETVDQGEFLILVEVQRDRDATKPFTWLYYQAFMQERHKIPAALVVVCTERGVGRWAAKPRMFSAGFACTATLTPIVLSAANIPKVTSVDDAERDIPLAMFSVVVHAGDSDHHLIMQALCTAMRERSPAADLTLWNELVEQGLGPSPAADVWREMMGNDLDFFTGPTSQRLRAEGREEGLEQGRAEQRAQDIVRILRLRGVAVSGADRERILGCADAEVLGVWLDLAVHAAKPDELWDTGHLVAQRSKGAVDGHRTLAP